MKRPRTYIRKNQTADTLRRMIAGNFAGVQAARLVDYVERFRDKHRSKRRQEREAAKDPVDWYSLGIYF